MRCKSKSLSHFSRKLSLTRLEERETPAITALGNQFQINTFTTGTQSNANLASDADGDFVVVWESFGADGSGGGVFGRRYSAGGTTLSGEFQINTFTTGNQFAPAVAMDALGNFVVAWDSLGQDGDNTGVYAQRFNAAGVRLGPEVRVNQFTSNGQNVPAVAMSVDGDYVICWQSDRQEAGPAGTVGSGVFARRYAADGTALSDEFQVNSFVTNVQQGSDVAIDGDGDFVIVWESFGQQDGSSASIRGRRYSSAGVALGGEFQVNTFTTGPQTAPSVGMDAAGNFVIAWQSQNEASATSGFDVVHRLYSSAGTALNSGVPSAQFTASDQTAPDVSRSALGPFVVGFVTQAGVRGRSFNAGGGPETFELTFNSSGTTGFTSVAVASDAEGDFVAAWSGEGTGDTTGVFGQRFDESVDAAAPWAVSLFAAGEPSPITNLKRLVAPVSGLVLTFSEAMATAGGGSVTAISNYLLNRNGTNINAQITSVSFPFNNTLLRHEATFLLSAPLDFGDYTLATRSSINDAAGNGIDGNFDGAPGGSFSVRFRVAPPSAIGPELLLNLTTTGTQSLASVAVDAAGNYVVAWESPDGGAQGIVARRFANDGSPLTGDIAVNTFTTGGQRFPQVGSDAAGNFVVVWESQTAQDGNQQGVFGRRFSAGGSPLGGEFQANAFTTGGQIDPHVAVNATGEFVVTWTSFNQDGAQGGIYARRYAADGAAGAEFLVNVTTASNQNGSRAGIDSFGRFVVAWESIDQDGSGKGVFFRRFDATRALDTADLRANVTTTGDQLRPSVAVARGGEFVIAWDSDGQDGSGLGVYARQYFESGAFVGGEFRVSETTTGDQDSPAVAIDADGDFAVVWQSDPTGSSDDVFLRGYSAGGDVQGGEVRANTTTTNLQGAPSVAADADGDLLVAWHGNGGVDGSGIFARRFADATPPPRVANVQVNDGTAQRSRVTSLTVTFNSQVTIAGAFAASFILTRAGGANVTLTGSSSVVGGVTVVTLNNFTGAETENGSLRDGRYTLTVNSTLISSGGGLLDGNGDGIGDDDFTFGDAQGLFRFYGDMNGDRRADISDFGFFSAAYLQGPGANNPFLDFNQDGRIDISDFGQFSARYFTNLP